MLAVDDERAREVLARYGGPALAEALVPDGPETADESHVEVAWQAVEAAEARGEALDEATIDALIAEAERRDEAGVPLAPRGGDDGARKDADAAYARLMQEHGVVSRPEDAFALNGAAA